MAVVTSLQVQKDKSRANVYLDGVFVCGLEIAVILSNGIKVGTEITQELLEDLKQQSDREKANKYALSLVNKKRYTKRELINKLKAKEISGGVISEVINKMEEYHYIDDASFVRAYVHSVSGKSIKELEFALLNKGIDKATITAVFDEMDLSDDNEVLLLAKKFMKYKENTKENTLKLYAYLYRKGFNGSVINETLRALNIDYES